MLQYGSLIVLLIILQPFEFDKEFVVTRASSLGYIRNCHYVILRALSLS